MAQMTTFDRILTEVRIELVDMLASNHSGAITIHVTDTNQLSATVNRVGSKERVSADEIALLQQTTPRKGEQQTVARREARHVTRVAR